LSSNSLALVARVCRKDPFEAKLRNVVVSLFRPI
jgi:hypothetical protein